MDKIPNSPFTAFPFFRYPNVVQTYTGIMIQLPKTSTNNRFYDARIIPLVMKDGRKYYRIDRKYVSALRMQFLRKPEPKEINLSDYYG
jgi:hypothetical protein